MKRLTLFALLAVSLLTYSQASAQFGNPNVALGLAVGGAQGHNSSADKWGMQYRGFLQYKIISPLLLGQLGVGYTELQADGVYSAQTVMADNRLLLVPFSSESFNPFLYGGFGVSKAIDKSNTDFLPMIPLGVGIQTRLGSQAVLQLSGGYNLSLSDKLDGRQRSDTDLNDVTNKKQDGFFGFSAGFMFAGPSANADRDHDGLTNRIEKELGTDPKNADTDGDGLSDGAEVNQHRTDPLKADTDGDVLSDGAEVNQYKTNPLKADTDGDGLADGAEVNKYKSDPLKIDTDDGGTNDGAEAARLSNLFDPADDIQERIVMQDRLVIQDRPAVKDTVVIQNRIVLEKGKKVVLEGINFEFGKATLTSDSKPILEDAYAALVSSPEVQVEISGHTDYVGSDASNQRLSLRRAQTVKNWLVERGTAANRMKTVGKGESEPVGDNDTDAGRAENRRIEFYVQQ